MVISYVTLASSAHAKYHIQNFGLPIIILHNHWSSADLGSFSFVECLSLVEGESMDLIVGVDADDVRVTPSVVCTYRGSLRRK